MATKEATRKEYASYEENDSIASNDLIKYKDGTSGTVYKITEEKLSEQVQDDLFDNTADTAIASTDKIVKESSDGTKKTVTEAVLSAQIQDDLFDGDVATTSTVDTDKIPIEQSGAQNNITPEILFQRMKGYKEYTFAIRQSGTDAPTITVIKDDFGLVSPLTFTYGSVGSYACDVSSLGLTSDRTNIFISNNIGPKSGQYLQYITGAILGDSLTIKTYSGVDQTNSILNSYNGVVISIHETLG